MILQCPACRTRYVVPDSAIGAAGRQVRCASCRHSWFQDGAELELTQPITPEPLFAPAPASAAPAPAPEPVAAEPSYERASPEDLRDYQRERRRSRRNPAKLWTIAAAAAALLMLLGVGAIGYFGSAGIAGRLGLPVAADEAPLLIEIVGKPERRTLASGNELFALTGRVVNPTREPQRVPDILAELRDPSGRVVYGWRIVPPVRTLPARGATEFNSAEVDVPKGARELNLSFAGQDAG